MAWKAKTHRYRRSSSKGQVTVRVTAGGSADDYAMCNPNAPVRVAVSQGRKTWGPQTLCFGPVRDPHTAEGRQAAVRQAIEMFEEDGGVLA